MQVVDKNGRIKVEITNTVDDLSVGITTVSGGVSGRVLYDNAGVLGELDLTSIYVPTSRTLTINGTTQDLSANRTFTVPTDLTVGTTPISSGTIGRFLFDDSGVLSETNGAFWDKVNGRFGIGTDTPASKLFLDGGVFTKKYYTNTTNQTINFGSAFELFGTPHSSNGFTFFINPSAWSSGWDLRIGDSSNSILFNRTSGITVNKLNSDELVLGGGSTLSFYRVSPATGFSYNSAGGWNFVLRGSSSENLRVVGSTGNVLINTTTDAGFRLDVNGTARVQNDLSVSRNQNNPTKIAVSNTTAGNNSFVEGGYASDASSGECKIGKYSSTTSAYKIITASNAYLYNGTIAGDIAILNDFSTGRIKFATGGVSTPQMNLFSTGNFAINTTTDAGFRLDVNGTARVSGNLTLGANNPQLIWTTGAFQLFYSTTRLMRVDFEGNYQLQKSLIVAPSSSTAINASAVMQADSTTQGFLPPRMTTTQKNAIASPATGLQVYDTTLNQISYYNGTTWTNI
jgi:hypothetical protein